MAPAPGRGSRRKPRGEWLALRPGAHEGYVDWERAEAIRSMVSDNAPASRHHGAPKHGDALLAGLLRCRRCGRKLTVRYTGARHDIPRYSCWRGWLDNGEPRCIAFGGLRVDDAIEAELLKVLEPAAVAAAVEAEAPEPPHRRDQVREALLRDLQAARYAADRAFRQYDATDPANRLVAAELEARWNRALERMWPRSRRRSPPTTPPRRPGTRPRRCPSRGWPTTCRSVWRAPTTDARLRKRIVRAVVQEVVADLDEAAGEVVLLIHWMGGVHTELRLPRRRRGQRNSTSPDIVAAVRQLVLIASDDVIAGMLNRNGLQDRPRQPLDPRARDGAAVAPRHPGPPARARGRGSLAEPQQGRGPPAGQPEDAAPRRRGRPDRGRAPAPRRAVDLPARRR